VPLQSSSSNTAFGWLLGFGVEYALPHWSGVIEYDYMDFGTNNVAFTPFRGGFLPAGSIAKKHRQYGDHDQAFGREGERFHPGKIHEHFDTPLRT
jgi:opacity protein-like surface antigen